MNKTIKCYKILMFENGEWHSLNNLMHWTLGNPKLSMVYDILDFNKPSFPRSYLFAFDNVRDAFSYRHEFSLHYVLGVFEGLGILADIKSPIIQIPWVDAHKGGYSSFWKHRSANYEVGSMRNVPKGTIFLKAFKPEKVINFV